MNGTESNGTVKQQQQQHNKWIEMFAKKFMATNAFCGHILAKVDFE